jgi:hypothetical protein
MVHSCTRQHLIGMFNTYEIVEVEKKGGLNESERQSARKDNIGCKTCNFKKL